MVDKDLEKFVEIMMGLAENYPGTRLTESGLDMRFEALKDYSISQVAGAAIKLIKTHRFNSMPTTADMINAMGARMSIEQLAEIEAGKVLDHLSKFGIMTPPRFKDPITRHLMSGRWKYRAWASRVQEHDLKWWSRDFIRAYKAHAAGIEAGHCLLPVGLPIAGLSSRSNQIKAIGA